MDWGKKFKLNLRKLVFVTILISILIFLNFYNFKPTSFSKVIDAETLYDETCKLGELKVHPGYNWSYDFCSFKGDSRNSPSSYRGCSENAIVQSELLGKNYTFYYVNVSNLFNVIKEEYSEQIDSDFHLVFSAEDPSGNFTLYNELIKSGLYEQELYRSTGYLSVCIYKSGNAVFFFGGSLNHCYSYLIYIIPKLTDSVEDLIKPDYLNDVTTWSTGSKEGLDIVYTPSSWELSTNGSFWAYFLNRFDSEINVTKVYIWSETTGGSATLSPPLTIPPGELGYYATFPAIAGFKTSPFNTFTYNVVIEYELTSDPGRFFNSTGTISGKGHISEGYNVETSFDIEDDKIILEREYMCP